jgi:hypothetical protein
MKCSENEQLTKIGSAIISGLSSLTCARLAGTFARRMATAAAAWRPVRETVVENVPGPLGNELAE